MKTFLAFLTSFGSLVACSQQTVDVNKLEGLSTNAFYTISGSPVIPFRYVRLTEGTPFFRDTWMKGLAVTNDGKRFKSDEVKLNLLDNELYFLTSRKEEFVCTAPLKEIVLMDSANKDSFRFVYSPYVPLLAGVKKGWYQPLAEGKASLYLFPSKMLHENKPYNSPVTEQKISTTNELWLISKGEAKKIKKPKDLPLFLGEKKAELEQFLKSADIASLSATEQIVAMVQFFNRFP